MATPAAKFFALAADSGERYDYYVDSAGGNDANDGRSLSQAWQTLGRIVTFAQGTQQTGALTLTATSGTVTATRSSGVFAAADVGKCLYQQSGLGAGKIVAASGTNVCTLEVSSAFSSTSVASGTYYIAGMLDGMRTRIKIAAGTYTNQSANITRSFSAAARTSVLELHFGAGSVVEWTAGTDQSAFQALGANWLLDVHGHGSTVQGFSTGTGNGFGAHNTAAIAARRWTVDNCVDGISGHNDAYVYAYDCLFRNCTKGGYTHVQNTRGFHYRCTFEGRSGASLGIGYEDATCQSLFEDCVFTPAASGQGCSFGIATVRRSKFGTLAAACPIGLPETAGGALLEDCFMHQSGDARIAGTLRRCYGKFSMRLRGTLTNPDLVIENCIFVDSSTGSTYDGFLWGNNDGGTAWQGQGYIIRDSIFKSYAVAIGNGFSANQYASFNSASTIANCCFHGNSTNIHASITIATTTITADPLLGPCSSTNQLDWAIGVGSPCIGAGSSGGNIGFN